MSGRPVLVTSLRGRQEEGHHSQPQAPSLQPPRLTNDLGSSSTSPDGGTASSLSRGCTRACIPCLSDLAVWLRRHGWFSSLSGGEIGTANKTTIPAIGIYCIYFRPFRRTLVMAASGGGHDERDASQPGQLEREMDQHGKAEAHDRDSRASIDEHHGVIVDARVQAADDRRQRQPPECGAGADTDHDEPR